MNFLVRVYQYSRVLIGQLKILLVLGNWTQLNFQNWLWNLESSTEFNCVGNDAWAPLIRPAQIPGLKLSLRPICFLGSKFWVYSFLLEYFLRRPFLWSRLTRYRQTLFGGGSKVFELCVYAPLFSNFDQCPVNFIGHLDTEITLFSMQF